MYCDGNDKDQLQWKERRTERILKSGSRVRRAVGRWSNSTTCTLSPEMPGKRRHRTKTPSDASDHNVYGEGDYCEYQCSYIQHSLTDAVIYPRFID